MSVVKTYNSQLTIFLKPTHSITISLVGLILLICIRLFTITCTLKRNKSPKGQCNHLSATHLSIEIGPTDLPTFSFNWTPRLKRNCISKISDFQTQTNKENIFHDIHLERELEWGCVKEVDNGQTKYDCFHLSRIKVPVPNCNVSLEDYKSNIFLRQSFKPRQLE